MTDRRELIARAIYATDHDHIPDATWEGLAEDYQADYLKNADAVLAALEPWLMPEMPPIDEELVALVVSVAGDVASSKGAARRLIAQGAVRIHGEELRVGKRTYPIPAAIRNALNGGE